MLLPLAIWLVFTAIGAAFLAVAASHQIALERTAPGYHVTAPSPASPGYLGVIGNWDGQWYRSIADHGYPRILPVDEHGVVKANEWAFYPVYPMVVRGVMAVTGASFNVSAWAVSLVFGAVAMVVLFRLVKPRVGTFNAAALVASLMAYVTAPVLQVAYTEGVALLLVVLFIRAVQRRQLTVAVLLTVALSLTRPVALPLGLVLAWVVLSDWRASRRQEAARRIPIGPLLATCAVLITAGLWPMIAWVVTGRRGAFFETQAAWPVNRNGLGGWLGDMAHLTSAGVLGIAVVLLVALVSVRPKGALWGQELRVWSVAYPLYLLAASRPSPSIFRYLMLAITPLWPFPEVGLKYAAEKRWVRWLTLGVVVAAGLVLQFVWVSRAFTVARDPGEQLFP
ncbi:hypothetical protein GCM10009740_03130 [Terrabacter terrae]|uniref:DUF2029 domain-containing protein n=1 Tax=Terrabacter terrae TaxID=318434 RepID=A0ABP5F6M2_9MICO